MKKTLLLLCGLLGLCFQNLQAQTLFYDDFSNDQLPNWVVANYQPGSTVVWQWDASQQTGNGYFFDYDSAANGALMLDSDGNGSSGQDEHTTITSRAIDCSGQSLVLLSFYEFYARYQNDTPEVYISTDSTNWTMVYTPNAGFAQDEATTNPHYAQIDISAQAANQPKVYIMFSWKGSWDYFWFIDDVRVFVPDSYNLAAVAVGNTISNGCTLSATDTIRVAVQNLGQTAADTFIVYYTVDGGTVNSDTVALATGFARDSFYIHTFTQTANVAAPGLHTIKVWVQFAGDTVNNNDTVTSNSFSLAPINPATPYTQGFEIPPYGTDADAGFWRVEDANGDQISWYFSVAAPHTDSVNLRYMYNDNGIVGANDWAISTCIEMDSAKAYKVSFWDMTGLDYPEKLEVKAGTTQRASAMTEMVKDFGELIDSGSYVQRVTPFKPATTGTYYIGFHVYSDADMYFLNIDDFGVSELPKPNVKFGAVLTGDTLAVTDSTVAEYATNWLWNWGDGNTDTMPQPGQHQYAQPGTYNVCLTVTNLAGSNTYCQTITIQDTTTIGISHDISAGIGVFPNPTSANINVFMGDAAKNVTRIEIVNAIGQTVISNTTSGNTQETINLHTLAGGVYYLRLTGNNVKAIRKFTYIKN